LLFETRVPPAIAPQLSFVAGLAAHSAAAAHLPPEKAALLRLKWPNDLMLDGAKLAGVLLESLGSPNRAGLAVILGVGMNVTSAPDNLDRAVASLELNSAAIVNVFESLASAAQTWLTVWNEGAGFPVIREAWLARALALGEPIRVNLNGTEIRGMFRGVDPGGALQLETGPGVVKTITAGDIYLDAQS
jgi:BirA family transcriptional regulator, biotin operon repressor / biotin---[acetyl-CoA-carboxylase] ligase